jgi:hypothetical protein
MVTRNVGLRKYMKLLLLLLCATVASGCATRLDTASILDLRVSDPITAMGIGAHVTTPKETIGEKLSHFISTVIREHPQNTFLPVYIEPSVACVQIAGWETPENTFYTSSIVDVSVRECLAIFCDMVGGCSFVETDEAILIQADTRPPVALVIIHGGGASDVFAVPGPFDD